jgi:multidrug efflux pump
MNNIISAILSRQRTVISLLLALVICGIYSYITIPKEANPNISVPVFYVSISQPGISSQDAEKLIIRPMESKLKGLEGLKEMTSVATESYAAIILEFDIKSKTDAVLADIRAKVDEARSDLPADANAPNILETNFALIPSMIISLSGDIPERTLYQHAKTLEDEIEKISTVLRVDLNGIRDELIEVIVDTTKIESYQLTPNNIINAVNQNNSLISAGFIDNDKGKFNIKVPGLFKTAEDIYSIPIKKQGNIIVTLKDIATINRTFKDATSFSSFNGNKNIALNVLKRADVNIIDHNKNIKKAVDKYTVNWPESIKVTYTFDESKTIFETLSNLQSSILTAIALVMIVVVSFLGLRSAFLIGIAIPISFLIGFFIINTLGMTVNIMVLFGLIITVGMLVDGAIVIIEYADKLIKEGKSKKESYLSASQRMFWPIASSTATTLAAFVPMLLWPGVAGQFMSYLPIMVIIVLSTALVTAIIFLPALGSIQFKKKEIKSEKSIGTIQLKFLSFYPIMLRKIIKQPVAVLATTFLLIVSIFTLFIKYNNGVEYFVSAEPEQAVVFISARGNLSTAESNMLSKEIEKEILKIEGIKHFFMTVGTNDSNSGNPGDVQDKPVDAIATLYLELESYNQRRPAEEIFNEIRKNTIKPGTYVEIRKIEGGPPTGKDIRLEIISSNYLAAKEATGVIKDYFTTSVEGLIDIEDTRPLPGLEWQIEVDREKAGKYNTSIASIGPIIQLVTNGVLIGKYIPDDSDDELDIRIRIPDKERNIDNLDRLKIQTSIGSVPLSNFITRKAKEEVSSITRKSGKYFFSVKANTIPGITSDSKIAEINNWIKAGQWPEEIEFKFRGADEEQKEAGAFLSKAALGAIALMFLILITQFNSFYQTVLTLSTVILSIAGVLLGMLITGQTFSIIMTGTGIVALAGIVVNNSIVFIDTYNINIKQGIDQLDAIIKTASERIRPILLTTITTIMGLIPMATQVSIDFISRDILIGGITAGWWVQMSTAIIFGLTFATILTLILLPTMLALPVIIRERFKILN